MSIYLCSLVFITFVFSSAIKSQFVKLFYLFNSQACHFNFVEVTIMNIVAVIRTYSDSYREIGLPIFV